MILNIYLLPDEHAASRSAFAIKLIEKAAKNEQKTAVISDNDYFLTQIDNALWCNQPSTFISHERFVDFKNPQPPDTFADIMLFNQQKDYQNAGFEAAIVIDLSQEATLINAPKVMLIASQSPEILVAHRHKYRLYQQAGFTLNTYHIKPEQI